jgi:BioD-like phosphotransacetylase family protein
MAVLAVVSDSPGAGKTAVSSALARLARDGGKTAAVYKPVGPAEDPDVAAYENLLGQRMNGASRLTEGEAVGDSISGIRTSAGAMAEHNDLVVVELSSALSETDSARIAEALDARVVAVVGYRPDLEALEIIGATSVYGGRRAGVVINGLTRYKGHDTESRLLPSVEGAGVNVLGVIPEDRTLLGITVAEVADYLGGRNITDVDEMDRLVEHFQVGGLGLDRGTDYFDLLERKAVVVRGDRPDIQMPALRTPMACMMLTMGIEPIEYVLYEAEEQEVPIILVDQDTIPAMELLHGIHERARFDHPDKLARFTHLLKEHTDIATLLGE